MCRTSCKPLHQCIQWCRLEACHHACRPTSTTSAAVALTNVTCLEEPTRRMLALAAMGRARYAALMQQQEQRLTQPVQGLA